VPLSGPLVPLRNDVSVADLHLGDLRRWHRYYRNRPVPGQIIGPNHAIAAAGHGDRGTAETALLNNWNVFPGTKAEGPRLVTVSEPAPVIVPETTAMPLDGVRDLFTERTRFRPNERIVIVNVLKPSASVPPEATVTGPEIVPLPPRVRPS